MPDESRKANYSPHFQKRNEVGGYKLQISDGNIIKDISKHGL